MEKVKKILIVNVNWVGDVIFSTPFIRAVREACPDSHIACLIHPRCAEVLEGNPRLNEIIIYDEEGIHRSLPGKLRLISSLRAAHFDTAFILHRSVTKAVMTMLAGVRERVGYAAKRRSAFLTKVVDEPAEETHKVEYFLNIARASGIAARDNSYEFFISDADRSFIKDLLRQKGVADKDLLVVMCPGGNWGPKRWPKENFARLADLLIDKYGVKVALAGATKDIVLAEEISEMVKHDIIITCGGTTLKGLGALLERADLVVANDTGPMHTAVAMKTKVIALFGPTSPGITGPYGKGNYRVISRHEGCDIPCYDLSCTDNRCMAAILVEDVLREAESMLAGS
ncbi:MAG: lipopolysaccharide heptosyltransferase II [Candidatus Omnitrophota bacterium]